MYVCFPGYNDSINFQEINKNPRVVASSIWKKSLVKQERGNHPCNENPKTLCLAFLG